MITALEALLSGLSQAFRLAIPGIAACFLVKWARPNVFAELSAFLGQDPARIAWAAVVLAVGMTAYAIHRSLLLVVDVLLWLRLPFTATHLYRRLPADKWRATGPWAGFLIAKYGVRPETSKLDEYLEHRWSMAHSLCILGELTVAAALVAKTGAPLSLHRNAAFAIGSVLLALGFCSLFLLFVLEKRVHERR